MTNKKQIEQNKQETEYLKLLQKQKERKTHFETDGGISIDPLYSSIDEDQYYDKLGFPGMYPYTRGIHSSMYRSRLWTMRQYAGFGTTQETNKRFKYLLQSGTTGLSVAFDLPTQMGIDSDHPLAEGEVGKVGVPICSLADMETLFKNIPLEKVSTSMTINSTASILLALYISIAKKQGVDLYNLSGTIQNDILKEYIARGTYIFPPEPSMRIITDIFKYCHDELPTWNTISISGYHIREAGSTAIQELAFTFANAIAYVEAAINSGLDIDEFSSRLSFFFNAHNDLFEEIAKFRAARRMWAKIMRKRFKAKNDKSLHMRFHAQTGGSTLTAQQPMNNIARVTLQALAAILGGAQSLHTNSFDEALALPTEDAVRIALRTQQIIAHESGITASIDPLGGSYFIEHLTDKIEEYALDYLKKIDEMGGAIEAIKNGFFQDEISQSAYDYQKKVETNEKIIVGLNSYMNDEESNIEILKIEEDQVRKQIQDLQKFKKNRNSEKVAQSLAKLEKTAQSNKNIMPYIINCIESLATLGEISDCLRNIFGVHQEDIV